MTEREIHNLTDRIIKAAVKGDRNTVDDLVEKLRETSRKDGMDDLAIELWDAKEVGAETVEFMVENNGVADPR